jgi:chemotaxis regulatin CheY-phosphate phosphatase CheZ
MSTAEPLNDAQFTAVEEAMAQTELGRTFLDEFARRTSVIRAAEVMDVLGDVRESLKAQSSSTHVEILRRELQEMSASIMQTRNEIAAIKPEEAGNNRIMAATGELDAIVTAAERATSEILTSAEQIQDVATALREAGAAEEQCDALENEVTSIFTACSFQDITGQRTTKVVNVLRYLEQRVNTMIEIWGIEGVDPDAAPAEESDDRPDSQLMEGPQMDGEGVSQDDIDRILQEMLGGGGDDASSEPEPEPEPVAAEG